MGSSILGWQAALVREAAVKKKDVAAAPAVALTLASKFPPRVSYKVCARGYLRYFYSSRLKKIPKYNLTDRQFVLATAGNLRGTWLDRTF